MLEVIKQQLLSILIQKAREKAFNPAILSPTEKIRAFYISQFMADS